MFRQLLPKPATVELLDLLYSLDLTTRAPDELPYTIVNFISSADGRVTFQGRSGALGDDGDKAIFHGLREQVDAVLVGTQTLRVERYGRIIRKPERHRRREQAGRDPDPLACIVTRTGEIPFEAPLFEEPEQRVAVFSAVELDVSMVAAQVDVVTLDPGELTLTTVLRRLRLDYGVASLLCEGGPMMFGSLLVEGLADELFLTVAPKLTGGGAAPTIVAGPELPELVGLTPLWLLENNGALYLRYAVGTMGS